MDYTQVVVGLVGGGIMSADPQPHQEVLDSLSSLLSINDAIDKIETVIDTFKRVKEMTFLSLEISGKEYFINPPNILWIRVDGVNELLDKIRAKKEALTGVA